MVLIGAWNALARWAGRYIGTNLSSNALIETQWYLFALLFLIAASYTLKHNEHVRVDVFYGRTSKRTRAWIDLIGGVVLLLPFCIFAILFTWPGVVESWSIGEVSPDPGGLPRYPLKAVVPAAFGLLFLQGLSETAKRALWLAGFRDSPDEPQADSGAES